MSRLSSFLAAMLAFACAAAGAQDVPDPVEERFFAVQKRLDVGGTSYRFGDYEGFLDRLEAVVDEVAVILSEGDPNRPELQQFLFFAPRIKQMVRDLGAGEVLASGSSIKKSGDQYIQRSYMMMRPDAKGVFSLLAPPSGGLIAPDILPAGTDLLLDYQLSGSTWLDFIFETSGKVLGMDAATAEMLAKSQDGMAPVIDAIRTIDGEVFFAIILDEASRADLTLPDGVTYNVPQVAFVTSYEGTSSELIDLFVEDFRSEPSFSTSERAFGDGTAYDLTIDEDFPLTVKPTLVWDGKRGLMTTNRDVLMGYLANDDEYESLAKEQRFKEIVDLTPGGRFSLLYSSGVLQQELNSLLSLAGMGAADSELKALLYGGILGTEPYLSVAHRDELGIGATSISNAEAGLMSGMGAAPTVLMAGVVTAIAIPSFIRAREISRRNACQENQAKIDGAKAQWALENNMPRDSTPAWDELIGPMNYIRTMPVCPSGGEYTMGTIDEYPYCSMAEQEDFPHEFPFE